MPLWLEKDYSLVLVGTNPNFKAVLPYHGCGVQCNIDTWMVILFSASFVINVCQNVTSGIVIQTNKFCWDSARTTVLYPISKWWLYPCGTWRPLSWSWSCPYFLGLVWRTTVQDTWRLIWRITWCQYQLVNVQHFCHLSRLHSFWSHQSFSACCWPETDKTCSLSQNGFDTISVMFTSSWRSQRNGLPQCSVLAPVLFNLYTNDLPATQGRKFIYADDICLATQAQYFSEL